MKKPKRIPLIEQDRLLLALRRLNMVVPNELPIISLYITMDKNRLRLKETLSFIDTEIQKFTNKIKQQGLDPEVMLKDIERIKEFIEFNSREEISGLAAFISGYRDLLLTYPINYRFKNEIVLNNMIYKAPLIRLLAEQPREAFLALSPDQSTLYRFGDGRLQEKEPPITRDRHQREKAKDYIRRVKDAYWPYFRSDDVKSVFLLGRRHLIDIFVSVLAKVAIQKIKEKVSLPANATKKDLEKIARNLIQKHKIINPESKVEHATRMAQRRMAVFGPEPVFQALREGKVKELLVDPSFDPNGWRCQRCQLLGIGKEQECPWCAGRVNNIKHLKSALSRDASKYDIQVTRVSHPCLKEEGGGIAALLRFS